MAFDAVKIAQKILINRRNQTVRNDPGVLEEYIEGLTIQKHAEKNGPGFFSEDCLTTWKPSGLPFHVEIGYFFLNVKHPICRLVSLKDPSDENIHEVQTKRILDHEKAVTHCKDDKPWWEAIVRHNLDKRTREEAKRVLAEFGGLKNVNRRAANKIASLINDEKVDLKLLEELTGCTGNDDETLSFPFLTNYFEDKEEAPAKVDKTSESANTARFQSLISPMPSADSTSSTSTVKTTYADSQVAEPSHTTRSSAEGLGIGMSRHRAPQEDPHVDKTTTVGVLESEASGNETCSHETPEEAQPTPMSTDGSSPLGKLPEPKDPHSLDYHNIPWTYITGTEYDKILLENGIWLFERPLDHFRPHPENFVADSDRLRDTPVIVSHNPTSSGSANISFNGEILMVEAARSPLTDLRSVPKNPAFLSPTKLAEYQAVESAGFRVWRHDRNTLECRKAGCVNELSDWNHRTLICNGCGPKTIIRYCSYEHKIQDLKEHWKECGDSSLLIKQVVDHTTEPPGFSYLCPALRDRHNRNTFHTFWQRSYVQMFLGHYAIVHPDTKKTMPLFWPRTLDVVKALEMDRRIERCLNIAFFDHKKTAVVVYLYRMVRKALELNEFWNNRVATQLFAQFLYQFNVGVPYECAVAADDPLCECEWVGPELRKVDHVPGCRLNYKDFGEDFNGLGVKAFVERMEAKYWILRAWHQQLGENSTWMSRTMGEGYSDVKSPAKGWVPKLGPGWLGWGAPAADLWEEMA
ncbi:MAG: hypothetical protein Q9214_004532 [Letrouitia sp. 1 TL-2023]